MQNTFSQSGNDSKRFLTKIIFQNRYVALETPSRPPLPFMANAILNFHFDFLNTSLMQNFVRGISHAADCAFLWAKQRVRTTFCKIYSGTLHLTIFGAPKYAPKNMHVWQNMQNWAWSSICRILEEFFMEHFLVPSLSQRLKTISDAPLQNEGHISIWGFSYNNFVP